MLYRRTPELPPLKLISNGIISSAIFPTESTQSGNTELYPRALWLEASLTKDERCILPTSDVKTIVSRKYNPAEAFKDDKNEISAKQAIIDTLSSINITAQYITATDDVSATIIRTRDICAVRGDISILHSNEIYTRKLKATDGKIDNISGDTLHFRPGNARIDNIRGKDISSENITAIGKAILTAAAVYWADLAELYESDNILEPGTLVKFNGKNEIEIASDGIANGVVSKNPAILMNSSIKSKDNSNPIIMVGRSIVKIKDKIEKFDRIELSDIPGVAQKNSTRNKQILGISLESKPEYEIKPVECVVKLAI